MAKCILCNEETDTRRVFLGSARGISNVCFDCALRFFKIRVER